MQSIKPDLEELLGPSADMIDVWIGQLLALPMNAPKERFREVDEALHRLYPMVRRGNLAYGFGGSQGLKQNQIRVFVRQQMERNGFEYMDNEQFERGEIHLFRRGTAFQVIRLQFGQWENGEDYCINVEEESVTAEEASYQH